jgi:hypothetical protein
MIEYKASGELLALSRSIMAPDMCPYLVLVRRTKEGTGSHVVSYYGEGMNEWVDGHYFDTFGEAHAYFVSELLSQLPIQHITIHPKMARVAASLHGITKRLEEAQ